ncbi:MAG: hypothetical protein WD382_08655 [Halofilum sp. (in: g-proteobacteria)]
MRRFVDGSGTEWTVALSNASYGSISLVFSATGAPGSLYWLALEAATAAEGQALLDGESDDDLRARLARAETWTG